MSTIQQLFNAGKTRTDVIEELMRLGEDEESARFMIAMELGEITGDVIDSTDSQRQTSPSADNRP